MEATAQSKSITDDLFTIVGENYKVHTPELKKPSLRYRLKGKPIVSGVVLLLIIGGCLFAELIMTI